MQCADDATFFCFFIPLTLTLKGVTVSQANTLLGCFDVVSIDRSELCNYTYFRLLGEQTSVSVKGGEERKERTGE